MLIIEEKRACGIWPPVDEDTTIYDSDPAPKPPVPSEPSKFKGVSKFAKFEQ